jgi:hypothetical protein
MRAESSLGIIFKLPQHLPALDPRFHLDENQYSVEQVQDARFGI